MSDTTGDLVNRASGGDRAAFGTLAREHWPMLVRLARSIVGDAEAEDVAQEALVVAWRKLPGLSDPERFPGWVARITFRRGLKRVRWRRRTVPLEELGDPGREGDTESRLFVWQVLARLAPRQRAVLHLTVVEGMADSEIGAVLGIAASSVRAHRLRARARLCELLKGENAHVGS